METAIMKSRDSKQAKTSEAKELGAHRVSLEKGGFVAGVCFDGEALWYLDQPTAELVRIDADSGKELKRIKTNGGTGGTTFDGKHLWQVSDTQLLELDPKSGKQLRAFDIPFEDQGQASGLAYRDGELWVGEHVAGKIHVIDAKTGALKRTLDVGTFVTGVEWSGDELWHGTHAFDVEKRDIVAEPKGELRRVDPSSGKLLARAKVRDGADVSGLAADGKGRMFYGDSHLPGVRVVRVS